MSPNSSGISSSSSKGGGPGGGSTILPIFAIFCAQLFTSSWHILGKHVMERVEYLTPISYVLIRTLVSSSMLMLVGILKEGYVPFPPLFLRVGASKKLETTNGSVDIDSGNSIGLALSQSSSLASMESTHSGQDKKMEAPQCNSKYYRPQRRRKKRRAQSTNSILQSFLPLLSMLLRQLGLQLNKGSDTQQLVSNLNPEAVQIILAGLAGMFLLPCCYTTGLIMTSATVASVWDGPMIPLGCFCAAVGLGIERRSTDYPLGQIGSLILTVSGSIVVLFVDFLHTSSIHKAKSPELESSQHVEFIRGNMVLMGVVVSYSATALLQRQLNHRPPIQLTAWMFGIGHLGCLSILTLDTILGGTITGGDLFSSFKQIYTALTTSPTFRYGLAYSALFVGGASFSIGSYASQHLESSVITLFAAFQPPITAVLEWIWEGKGLGIAKLCGMGCVFMGMHLFTWIKRKEREKVEHQSEKQKRRRGTPQCENAGFDHKIHVRQISRSPTLTNRKTADV